MNVKDLIAELQILADKHGDLEVLARDTEYNVLNVSGVDCEVAEKGEYPEDWNMPAGFKFILLNTI